MAVQYANYVSLVLHDVHGNCPVFPFDPSTGRKGNVDYHYHPSVTAFEMNNLGFVVSHYQDEDSRRICCLTCDDAKLIESPNLLIDAVEQGMAAWGGRVMTPAEALALAKTLEPARVVEWEEPNPEDPEHPIQKSRTYGEITLDVNDHLTREITEV